MTKILKVDEFLAESRGASLKNRTPDRFVEPETGRIKQQMLKKYNEIIKDYFSDYSYYDFDLSMLNCEYEVRDAANTFFEVYADIKTRSNENSPYNILIYFDVDKIYKGFGEILDSKGNNLFDGTINLTESQINFLRVKGFEPFYNDDNGVSCLKLVDKVKVKDGFYNWLKKENGIKHVLSSADEIPYIRNNDYSNNVIIKVPYTPNKDTWHDANEPTKAKDFGFEDFVRDVILSYHLLPLYYMDYIVDKIFGN